MSEVSVVQRWPDGVPVPTVYTNQPPLPCPKCRAVLVESGKHASMKTTIEDGFIRFRCRSCGHTWKLLRVPADRAWLAIETARRLLDEHGASEINRILFGD